MSVIKDGPGTWTLSGQNGYSGTVTVNAGTLVFNGQQATVSPVVINSGGTLKLTTNGQMNNAFNVIVNSGGVLDVSDYAALGGYTLPIGNRTSGAGTIKGPINVQIATNLAPGVGPVPGTLTIEGNVAYTGGGSATLTFAPGAHSMIDIKGDLTTSTAGGANTVDILGYGLTVGNHDLIKYTGALGGDGFSGFTLSALPPRVIATLVNDTAGKSIDLNVTGVDFPRWIGNVSSDWDINTTQNWKEVNSTNATVYLQPGTIGDAVLFDDQAVNPIVNLAATVSPAAVTFNNNTVGYVLSGGGGITGQGPLIKDGTGKAVIANLGNNDYAGGTFIRNGTLQIGDDTNQQGGSLGTGPVTIDPNGTLVFKRFDDLAFANKLIGTGDVIKRGTGITSLTSTESFGFGGDFIIEEGVLRVQTRLAAGDNVGQIRVRPGGTLDVSAQQMGPKPIFFEGAGHLGQGAIISTGNQNNALENVTMTGDATVGGSGRFDIRNLGNPITQLSTGGNAYNLTKIGTAQFSLVGVTVDPALGDVNVNEGTFSIETTTNGLGDANKTITLGSPVTLQFWALAAPLNKKLVTAGGTIASGSGTMNAFLGPVTLGADTAFRNEANTALALTNVVGGAGGLIKGTQTGALVLGSVNTYAGRTEIAGGSLTVISLANGGQPSGIGQSTSDAGNLILGSGTSSAGRLNFVGTTPATTDRLFTIAGTGATLDASGAAGAPLVFTNTGAAVMNNVGTAVTNLTLTGSNKDDNVLSIAISDGANGAVSPVGIVKSGAGTWVLAGNNSFSGVVSDSNGGILKIRSNTALGNTTGDTLLADNTANPNPTSLWLDSPTGLTVAENFRTTGGGGGGEGANGPGVIRSVSGNNVLSGTLTSQAGGGMSTYTVDAGSTLDLSGIVQNVATSSRVLHLGGAGEGKISGVIQNNPGTNNTTMGINKVGAGTWTVSGTTNTFTGPTSVGGGVLRVTGSVATSSGVTANAGGTFDAAVSQTVNALTVNDGGKALVTRLAGATGPTLLTTRALTIGTNTAQVDLGSNAMIVDYAAGSSPLAAVRSAVTSGYAGGAWTGPGIVSSTAAANPNAAVGYAEASDVIGAGGGNFMGQTVDGDSILTRYTLSGDATLDGVVDFNDLARLAQNYNVADGNRIWGEGDFTYDGNVDFNDLAKMAQNYNTNLPAAAEIAALGGGASFGEDLARAFAQVPEPGALTLLAVAGGALVGRRRRR
jgi:autotransporter-associated beta strand protein